MDKTFEDIVMDTLNELDSSNENPEESEATETEEETEVETEEDETDENESEEETDDEAEDEEESDEEEEESSEDVEENDSIPSGTNKDAEAFARMRTENKQYKHIVEFFDQKAKEMGMKDIQELIEKTNEADLAKKAKSEGIPLEVAKKLQELEQRVATQEAEKEKAINDAKYSQVKNTLDNFVQTNKLNDKQVNKLAKDLISDGINLDFFKDMNANTISRILTSYLPSDFAKQKELEKKEKIKKEVPVSSKSNGSSTSQEDEIEKVAKMLLERP